MNKWNVLHTVGLLLLIAILLPSPAAWAQSGGDYDLTWSTVDDGGRFSAGGNYWLGGAAGQPDAGLMSGGDFELSGGFWHIKTQYPNAVQVVTFIAGSPAVSGIAAVALLAVLVWARRAGVARSISNRKIRVL